MSSTNFADLFKVIAEVSGQADRVTKFRAVLDLAMSLTHADGGSLYLARDACLVFEISNTRSLNRQVVAGSDGPSFSVDIRTQEAAEQSVVGWAAWHRQAMRIDDAYDQPGLRSEKAKAFDQANGYRTQSLLVVPMYGHGNALLGVLQLVNAVDAPSGRVQPFTEADQQLLTGVAAYAGTALSNSLLIESQRKLLMAIIEMINMAVDEKSPYTGEHCRNVPALAMMLAEAASKSDAPPFASFVLDEAERESMLLAAMLHDCGKIATPVHVIDKATKLHTLFDRIELVATRFELFHRAVDLRLAQGKLSKAEAVEQHQGLTSDLEFLRRLNTGSEFVRDEDLARLQGIAQRLYITSEGELIPFLTEDEVLNLGIRRGTINDEERHIINRHVELTGTMLESLPWPEHLRRVPEYAANHHERVDGKGYPKGKTRDEMSLPARIMAVADVFEALTSPTRPYKQGKKLSDALAIMSTMAKTGHLDPEVYELFLAAQVPARYAATHVAPEQNDLGAASDAGPR